MEGPIGSDQRSQLGPDHDGATEGGSAARHAPPPGWWRRRSSSRASSRQGRRHRSRSLGGRALSPSRRPAANPSPSRPASGGRSQGGRALSPSRRPATGGSGSHGGNALSPSRLASGSRSQGVHAPSPSKPGASLPAAGSSQGGRALSPSLPAASGSQGGRDPWPSRPASGSRSQGGSASSPSHSLHPPTACTLPQPAPLPPAFLLQVRGAHHPSSPRTAAHRQQHHIPLSKTPPCLREVFHW